MEDTAVEITLAGLDPDGDTLTFAIVSGPATGSLGAITPLTATSAKVTYTPAANQSGAVPFTFRVTDDDTQHRHRRRDGQRRRA